MLIVLGVLGVHPVGVLLVAPVVLLVLGLVPPLGVVAGAVAGALVLGLGLGEVAGLKGIGERAQISRQWV